MPGVLLGVIMKLFFTFLLGGLAGFALGAWTPVGTMLNIERVSEMAAKVTGSEIAMGKTITLVSAEAQDKIKAAGSPEETEFGQLALVDFKAPGQDADQWMMALTDLVPNPITTASLQSSDNGEGSLAQDTPRQVTAQADTPGELSEADKQFIVQMNAAKAGLAQENEFIDQMLEVGDPNHPQHYFLQCVRQSNVSQQTMLSFIVDVSTKGLTMEGLEGLQIAFDADWDEVNRFAGIGVEKQKAMTAFFKILPAKTDGDRAMKKLALSIFETYTEAFDVEKTLAARLSDYPSLMELAANGDGSGLGPWQKDMGALSDRRMEILNERDLLVADYAAMALSS